MTKERLRRYQDIRREIFQLREQIGEIESRILSAKKQQLTGMPSAPSGGRQIEDAVLRYEDLLDRYRRMIEELTREQAEIESTIESLEPGLRTLLRYRYLDGLKWEEICVRMSYSWQNVHRLHKKALDLLKERE